MPYKIRGWGEFEFDVFADENKNEKKGDLDLVKIQI